jgi:minor extracellular serine protease Vpr
MIEITNSNAPSTTVLMDKTKTLTADYVTQYNVTFDEMGVGSDFTGTVVVIDGTNYGVSGVNTLPASFSWDSGSVHTFDFQSPLLVTARAEQYVWISTTGLSTLQGGNLTVSTSGSLIGNYEINPRAHDIAVFNVALAKTIIGKGFNGNVTVYVANSGEYAETFNVTVYANATVIGTQQVTNLNATNETTLTFMWNTTGFAKGNYTVSAVADIVSGETNTANNNFTDGVVTVAIAGDVNADGKVDMKDISIVAKAFGTMPGDGRWNANADVNNDGKVDMKDISAVAKNFGKKDP